MNRQLERDLLERGFTRRSFARISSLLAGAAALPFFSEPSLAQLSDVGRVAPDAVRINANENPLGPCREAAEAIHGVVANGGRYLFEEGDAFASTLAEVEGLRRSYVLPAGGSSDPLHRAVLAFTSPSRGFVTATPGYEAGLRAAEFIGAKVTEVPLTKDHRHDVRAMAAADPNAGLIYVCNPNNPTGTITPKQDIEWLAANKPAGAVILLDEAYIHLSHSASPAVNLVQQDKDVIVLRTFSKLYGMAGLRAGAALARPDLLAKLRPYGVGFLPVAGMVGATASLRAKYVVPERRKLIREIREEVFTFCDKHGFGYVPSESNKFMLEAGRPGPELIRALAEENVYVGRVWPAWPNHVRVSIGTRGDMARFEAALLKVSKG